MSSPGLERWDVDRPIVVDVAPRSGSNLLRVVLNAHPECYIASGSALVGLIAGAEQAWAPLRDLLAQEQPETARREEDLLAAVRAFHCAFWTTTPEPAALGKSRASRWGFLDYTPPPPPSRVSLRQVFPRARFVALVRDGRDVVASWLANWQLAAFRSGLSQRSPTEVARFWVQKTAALDESTTLVLKLEQLADSSTRRASLERLAAWCELPFPPTWEPLVTALPWINSEKQLRARWRSDLDSRALAALERVHGFVATLERFGYR